MAGGAASTAGLVVHMILDPSESTFSTLAASAGSMIRSRPLEIPERALAAAVLEQAWSDALGLTVCKAWDRYTAQQFFRDWRLELYCSIVGLDTTAVRERFERRMRERVN